MRRSVDAPTVERFELFLLGITQDGYLSLLDFNSGATRQDIKVRSHFTPNQTSATHRGDAVTAVALLLRAQSLPVCDSCTWSM